MRLLLFNLATDADDPILGFTSRWIAALAKRVEFIHVITMRAGRVEVPENVRVYSVGKEKGFSEPRRAVEFYRVLFRVLRNDRIDVCFSHMIPIFTVLAAPVLKASGIPIITWYVHPSLNGILKLAHQLSDRMITSVPTAYPYKRDKLSAVGQGIDTDLFSPDSKVAPDEPPMILCVGRLSPVKDHPTLLKAAFLARERFGRPFRVVILGSPARRQDETYVRLLIQQVKDLRLEDVVSFEPAIPMAELPNWYRQCTIHVNLTPKGFGDKVALEAMACARPCLVANEGFRETLGDSADVLLFRYKDPEDLAYRLEWLLAAPSEERVRIGYYLRERVIQMHSLDALARKLCGVFSKTRQKGRF